MTERVKRLIDAVDASLAEIDSKIPDDVFKIEGYSGKQYKKFANRLLGKDIVKNYLEIGVWKGSTAIAALYGNTGKLNHWVIDNWVLFGGPRTEFVVNFLTHLKVQPNLIDEDCFGIDVAQKGISNIDVYFYDGEHEEQDQYKALTYYYNAMSDSFVYMVDDWSWSKVQAGTYNAIADLNLKIEKKIEFVSENDHAGWWNGCAIFVMSKSK